MNLQEGDILFIKKARKRGPGMMFEFGLRQGAEAIGIMVGVYDQKRGDPLPTLEDITMKLADIGFYSFDLVVEFFGKDKLKEFGEFLGKKVEGNRVKFEKRKKTAKKTVKKK